MSSTTLNVASLAGRLQAPFRTKWANYPTITLKEFELVGAIGQWRIHRAVPFVLHRRYARDGRDTRAPKTAMSIGDAIHRVNARRSISTALRTNDGFRI